MNSIPRRFPATLSDCYVDLMAGFLFPVIQLELAFDRALDAGRLEKAVDLTLDAEPVLGCRLVDGSGKLCFERLESENRSAFLLAKTAGEYEAFRSASPDERNGPQLRVCLWPFPAGGRLLLKVPHQVADAGGVKDIAAVLSGTYRRLSEDPAYRPSPNVKGSRSFRQVLRHVPALAYPRIFLNLARSLMLMGRPHTVHTLSITDGAREPLAYVTRLLPSERAEAVANLSASLLHWPDLGTDPGADFQTTLERVARITTYGKRHWIGFELLLTPIAMAYKVMPHAWGMKRYSEWARLGLRQRVVDHALTNTGPIDPESVTFGTRPSTAHILPPQTYPPMPFMWSLSGYNGTLTLTAGAYPTQKEAIEEFFDAILKELPA